MRWILSVCVALCLSACGGSDKAEVVEEPVEAPEAPAKPKRYAYPDAATRRRKKRRRSSPTARKPSTPTPPPTQPALKEKPADPDRTVAAAAARAAAVQAGEQVKLPAFARKVAADISAKRYSYSREMLKRFQAAAGLVPDGIYGGGTAGALRHFLGGQSPPRPLFLPTTEREYPQKEGAK